ncbi:MAG: ATP-dependent zinc metalloprotease FtsH [Pelotomaculum sp. PtaB.Bin104]|nr:MAG: ATP-dependent zinc metalloprotease FtsH [Pelotomaculum sp. PtaB.Bin104]
MVCADDPSEAYHYSLEHLSDELKRLDLLIQLQLLKQQHRQPANPLEQFKGLIMTEQEIEGLLNDDIQDEDSFTGSGEQKIADLTETLLRLDRQIQQRRTASINQGVYLSLHQLSMIFNLSLFEERCLLICLAPELNRKYEKLYAYLQDDITRKKPSIGLLMDLLCRTADERVQARWAFGRPAPMLKFGLIHIDDEYRSEHTSMISRFLKLDDRITGFLLETADFDERLDKLARLSMPVDRAERISIEDDVTARLKSLVGHNLNNLANSRGMIVHFYGAYGSGKQVLADRVCFEAGLPLVLADLGKMPDDPRGFEDIMRLLGREALLQQAALCLTNLDHLVEDIEQNMAKIRCILETCRRFTRLTFLLGSKPWQPQGGLVDSIYVELELPVPDEKTRQGRWQELSENISLAPGIDFGELAGKFRFTPGQIRDALAMAQNLASWRSGGTGGVIDAADLYTACRSQSNQKLGKMAQKLNPKYVWKDIVLPADQLEHLNEICRQVKYRHIVYGDWGFNRKLTLGKGINVLFCGPPGTGKTMAAEVLANELGLDLYKIDLSQVVSKFVGETEKNLENIFREAYSSNAILFFDEADALFGKRSEVKDAHDRYANIEIAYLLQKMEEYDGITILASNLRKNMDEAFIRRLQFIIEFPFPNEEYRERIWQAIFPPEAPRSDDIDLGFLARKYNITGGNIKNIVLTAAFIAAEGSPEIGMKHLIRATQRELRKMGKICMKEDFGKYFDYLD